MSNLLWYFQQPSTDPFLQLTYMEFFNHYYLDTLLLDDPLDHGQIPITHVNTEQGLQQKVIHKHLNSPIITRLQTVPVQYKELFYLRALLQVHPAMNFQDLRTINSQGYHTYCEAATALGLFRDLREAKYALSEAIAAYSHPSQLRFLFV
jgi:hypothetical protein